MQGGPNKYIYSTSDVIKFTAIAKLDYDSKQIAMAALTENERKKYHHFFENLQSDYNESAPKPLVFTKPKSLKKPLSAVNLNEADEDEELKSLIKGLDSSSDDDSINEAKLKTRSFKSPSN